MDKNDLNKALESVGDNLPNIIDMFDESSGCNENMKRYLNKNKDEIANITKKNGLEILDNVANQKDMEKLSSKLMGSLPKMQNNKRFKKGENVQPKNRKKAIRAVNSAKNTDKNEYCINYTILNLSRKLKNRVYNKTDFDEHVKTILNGRVKKITKIIGNDTFYIYHGTEGGKNKLAISLLNIPQINGEVIVTCDSNKKLQLDDFKHINIEDEEDLNIFKRN